MIVLDTNILSELQRPSPDPRVRAWLSGISILDVYLCSPVIMEQAYGAECYFLKTGSRRYLGIFDRTLSSFSGRILSFTNGISEATGRLKAQRDNIGKPISLGDAMIAAICVAHGATLATRNVRDFEGLDLTLINPFEAQA